MSATAQATPTPTPDPDDFADEALHYRAVLRKLVDMGTDIATEVHAESKSRPHPAAAPRGALTVADYARAYERIARGIRRGMLLARELAKPLPARRSPAEHQTTARLQILRAVEDKIHRHADDEDAAELQHELLDRLDGPDLARDIAFRPVADLIIEISRDLGLESVPGNDPWKRRKPRDLALLRTRAAGPHPAPVLSFTLPQQTTAAPAVAHSRAPPARSA